ncbi:MAG: TolC family protein [Deltaproteobacteria bacterium]|nr:TolC family protein [Deltaproteobacteria bacterium]
MTHEDASKTLGAKPLYAMVLICAIATADESIAYGRKPASSPSPQAIPAPVLRVDKALTLRQTMHLAAKRNLGLLVDRLEQRRVALGYAAAQAAFLPVLDLDTTYATRTPFDRRPPRNQRLQYGAAISWKSQVGTILSAGMNVDQNLTGQTQQSSSVNTAQHSSSLTLAATQPLLRNAWRAGAANTLAEAKIDIEVQRALFVDQLEKVLADVETAYWQLAFNQSDVANRKRAQKRAQEQYDDTKENIRRGILAEINIYVVEENLVFFSQQLTRSQQNLTLAQRKLAQLLLLDATSKISVAIKLTAPKSSPTRQNAIRLGLLQSPRLRAEALRLSKNRVELAFEKNQALPSLDLVASFSLNGLDARYGEHLAEIFTAKRPTASLGLRFSIPLSYSANRAKIGRANLARQAQLVALKREETRVRYQIGDVVTQMDYQRRLLHLAKRRLVLSKLKLSAEIQKYKNGISTLDSIVRFQRELDQAMIGVKKNLLALRINQVRLNRLQGTLHQRFGVTIKG